MRKLLLVTTLVSAALAAPSAGATRSGGEGDSAAAPADDPSTAAEAKTLLASLEAAKGKPEALSKSLEKLVALEPTPIETLHAFLSRDRATDAATRRSLLESIGAAVPDARGRFPSTNKREDKDKLAEADKFDWAAKLVQSGRSRALGEALADVAAIRALALSHDPRGAKLTLDFAFTDAGTIYRDECGRYLRKGRPWSIPGLIRGTDAHRRDVRRYANYELERIDRQAPHKALRAAKGHEPLQVEVLRAFADSLDREAIYVVLEHLDDNSPVLRRAARQAWHHYITHKPTRPPPKRRLTMTGGELSDKPEQLYLSHLELADIELRKKLEAIDGKAPARDATLEQMTDKLLAHYDQARAAKLDAVLDEGKKAAAAGDLAAAVARFDRVLVANPEHPARPEMAPTYLARGEELIKQKKYAEAATTLRKAHDIDPDGAVAKKALAKAHLARARMIEAAGGDSAAEVARAHDIDPDAVDSGSGQRWMLFVGIGTAVAGIFLLLAGLVLRRRRA